MIVIDRETWIFARAALACMAGGRSGISDQQRKEFRLAMWRMDIARGVANGDEPEYVSLLQPQVGPVS